MLPLKGTILCIDDHAVQFGLLSGRNRDLIECLLKVVQKRLPLTRQ